MKRLEQTLSAAGIIKESKSPYASQIVVVRNKNGGVRMCIDYLTLNSRTVPYQYTTPRIDEALDCPSGSKWFSVLDLRSGYYQIASIILSGCPKTSLEHLELSNTLWKRLLVICTCSILVYLDDLIVLGRNT